MTSRSKVCTGWLAAGSLERRNQIAPLRVAVGMLVQINAQSVAKHIATHAKLELFQ